MFLDGCQKRMYTKKRIDNSVLFGENMKNELKAFYKRIGISGYEKERLLHEVCPKKNECWTDDEREKKGAGWNIFSLPYIGDNYDKSICCIGLNFHEYGGTEALYKLIDGEFGAKKLLRQGKIRLKFDSQTYAGTFLFHRMAVYANIILGRYFHNSKTLVSRNNKELFYDGEELANIFSEMSYLQAIKCSPRGDKSTPIHKMYSTCPNIFLFEELTTIDPVNILVFDKKIRSMLVARFSGKKTDDQGNICIDKITLNNHNVNLFYITHPQSYGGSAKTISHKLCAIIEANKLALA